MKDDDQPRAVLNGRPPEAVLAVAEVLARNMARRDIAEAEARRAARRLAPANPDEPAGEPTSETPPAN